MPSTNGEIKPPLKYPNLTTKTPEQSSSTMLTLISLLKWRNLTESWLFLLPIFWLSTLCMSCCWQISRTENLDLGPLARPIKTSETYHVIQKRAPFSERKAKQNGFCLTIPVWNSISIYSELYIKIRILMKIFCSYVLSRKVSIEYV